MSTNSECVEAENMIQAELSNDFIFVFETPVYGRGYRTYRLDAKDVKLNKITPIYLTIRKNGSVLLTLNMKKVIITTITFKQRTLSKGSNFPDCLRIECGFSELEKFLVQFKQCLPALKNLKKGMTIS